ncbi:MAG: nucleotidyltransferase domain-containing protein [Comamonas sp.]|nr:nucleotidyltransferase domain-containing protein [Comamonas sp.]
MNYAAMLSHLQQAIPSLSALYVFGSQATGHAGPDSDLDLAVLADEPLGAEKLWDVGSQLADIAHCHVDLLDLRAASTVMQYRIITTGRQLWAKDSQATLYESFILSQKTALDEARAGLLQDIQKTGRVYGR